MVGNAGTGGSGGNSVNLVSQSVIASVLRPADASAAIRVGTDGILYTGINGDFFAVSGQWLTTPDGALADLYQVRTTLTSGVSPTGTLGSWLPLTADQTWTLYRTTVGTNACTLLVEVQVAATGVAAGSMTVSLEATKDTP